MHATVTSNVPSTVMPAPQFTFEDPLDDDMPGDEAVFTTRRGLCRIATVAAEAGARFQREANTIDPMGWMLASLRMFDGAPAIEACLDRDHFVRAIILHGLSLGVDAEPAMIDELVEDGAEGADVPDIVGAAERPGSSGVGSRAGAGGRRGANVLPFGPQPAPKPRLFTATIVHDDGFETVHAFHASFAVDEAEIAGRLHMRMGAAAANAAIVTGFDHTSPIVEALVSQAICDTLMMIDAEPMSPLAAGLDLNIEQRFAA